MNCESQERLISKLVDTEVSSGEAAEVFGHLGQCKTCREFYFQLQRLNRSLETVKEENVPFGFDQDGPVKSSRPNPVRHLWSRRYAVRFPVAAVFVCALVIGLIILIQRELRPTDRETVYLMKLPEVVVTSDADGITDRQ